ncbi:hypothetical protein BDQ12DRAFT_739648 [Crucibulum laeve]|uniref:RRM domain-containing protein n=1 Tax=Crucibulum laeve TaxID=68775 RepID=A0A5C3LGM7_9AGAR|nr:hypothetical protein BDQ12DRAFT_739648 [Crucibulum laeve]
MSSFRSGARKPYNRPAARGDVDGQWVHDKAPTGPSSSFAGRKAPPTNPASVLNTKLLVSNLHYEITPKDLKDIFGQIGTLVREPLIRYDRSGRSTGTAIIAFETNTEAIRARNQFDGLLAKGNVFFYPFVHLCQPMAIAFDTLPPRNPRRSSSVPTLLNRIQKPPLLDRLSRDDTTIKAPSGPRSDRPNIGPIRSRPARPERAPRAHKQPKQPKTAAELDKELDAFMGDTETDAPAALAAEVEPPAAVEDVEMS